MEEVVEDRFFKAGKGRRGRTELGDVSENGNAPSAVQSARHRSRRTDSRNRKSALTPFRDRGQPLELTGLRTKKNP